jgi:ABC-type Fe3+-hydroxamate transport system substrate-binding protein
MLRKAIDHWLTITLLSVLLLTHAACDGLDESSQSSADGAGDIDGPRIVSLTPAITRMLIDMGKRDQIVGVSQEDDASLGLPVCGSYNNPVIARIVELKPDVVLTESPSGREQDVPQLLRKLSDEGLFELKIIAHSRSIPDVERALIDAEVGLGPAIGDLEAAEHARKLMSLRIELVRDALADEPRPRVLMLINPTTLGAIGTGVTHDELLRLAGGINALAHSNTGYLTLDRAQLLQTVRPDVILIFEPSGTELIDGDARLRPLEGLAIPAVMNRRVAVIRHPQAMLPATSLPEVMLEIALAIHPEKASDLQAAYDAADTIMEESEPRRGDDS